MNFWSYPLDYPIFNHLQSLMNEIFRLYLRKFVLVFFYDILIYSRALIDHLWHLKVVLGLLWDNQLIVNCKKCSFGQAKIEYLRHIIFRGGVEADPKKIKDMEKWPMLRDIRDLRVSRANKVLQKIHTRIWQDSRVADQLATEKLNLVEPRSTTTIWDVEDSHGYCSRISHARFYERICKGNRCFKH